QRPHRGGEVPSQSLDPGLDVAETLVLGMDRLVLLERLRVVPLRVMERAQLELQRMPRGGGEIGQLEPPQEVSHGRLRVAPLGLADTEHRLAVGGAGPPTMAKGYLELGDRF